MSSLLRAPLVAAAAVATACAIVARVHPLAGAVAGACAFGVAAALAAASADRSRRVLWCAVGIAAIGSVARVFVTPPPFELAADPHVAALRAALGAPLRMLVPEPESGILLGIVLGERASIGRDIREAFVATGTAHLLAISGFNMTLVASAVALALRGRCGPVAAAAATVGAVAAYSVLVGPSASVVRAALMASVTSLGLALGRRGAAANGLGAAVVAMLVGDPAALEDAGFLLSVAATAGLIAWQSSIATRLSRLPRPVADGLAATIAASLPTLPIVAAVFGRVSLVSPVANLVAVPLFAPIMLFGAAAAAVGAVSSAAAWPLAMAAYAATAALRHVVELCAAAPLASANVPSGPATGLALALALGAAVLAAPHVAGAAVLAAPRVAGAAEARSSAVRALADTLLRPGASRWPRVRRTGGIAAAGVLCIGVVAATAVATSSLSRPSGFRLHALDVGQGDAFLVESDGRYALVDGGPDPALVLRRLGQVLPPWERRIDLVVLTHEHADHGAGLLAVIDRYDVGLAIEPAGMNDVPFVRAWSERLARSGVPRRALAAGAMVRVGRAAFHVLAPGRDRRLDVPSLVIRAEVPGSSILFMGDATDDAIADLMLTPDPLMAGVYVPPHHGAESAHSVALVAAVRPHVAVLSVGASNRYGHPAPATIAALEGLPVYRTDRHGTVEIELDGPRPFVQTAKAGLPPRRGGPVPSAPPAR